MLPCHPWKLHCFQLRKAQKSEGLITEYMPLLLPLFSYSLILSRPVWIPQSISSLKPPEIW